MAKKNNKRKRKRKPLKANSKRQAHAQLRGYLYQIWHSVNAWLDLADDEVLYLEGAEDFDRVSDNAATAAQVKHTQRNITLRSQDVIDTINNFWELQADNPDRRVKLRFLTTSKIGKETRSSFGMDKSGIEVWSRCSGDEAAIQKISDFLQTDGKISEEVNDFLKVSSPQEIYEQLIEPITWETDSKPISYVEQSIRKKLVYHGDRYSVSHADAQKVVDHLLKEALTVATQEENRELIREHFLKIFAENTRISIPIQNTRTHQSIGLKTILNHIKEALIADSPDININIQSPIQDTIPPLYPNVIQRIDLLTNIQTKLQSESIVIIQGGVDTGKTTLAKLTANAIDTDWFWLKFTDKEASQIVQDLQQLADAVSNRSAQVNVILDDLNLQPQQLQAYEEDLGVVAYRVLERGAKLLITSQYKPPNNFIRDLGLSSSVVVPVSNFTIPEIEQFATEMGCPAEDAKDLAELFQLPTKRHPRLVHALFTQLQEKDWERQDMIESIFQGSSTMGKELEDARQLLAALSEDQREFLYRLSLIITEFRKDCALNIGEIPKPISHPGHTFSQLVGPWIDQVSESYYAISPLLTDAAKEIWSDENKIKNLHAHIANAIRKTKNLTTIEAWAVFTHSMAGQNKEGIIAFIYSLMNAPQNDWKNLCQEFALLAHIKTDPPEELFTGDAFLNQMFRSLQYRIAVEVEPELAPKILEIWDEETKPYEPYQSYLLSRLMLAIEVLRFNQVLLPAKKMVGYLKEMIDIKDKDKDIWDIFYDSMGLLEEHKTEKSNFFSILFGFIYARRPVYAPFLNDLIDELDELNPSVRRLLLTDFEDDTVDSRVLIDGIWGSEADLENPDWERCLHVFDKVIEKTIAWNYPHFAAAAARGKAMIYDEYLEEPESHTAQKVLQDFVSKMGPSPIIEEEQAVIYLHQKRYKEALSIYERILPEWNPPSGQLDVMPPEGCRRAAICAAHLDDWEKAAAFFEDGAKRTQNIEDTERHISFYVDAGFAHFKANNMSDSIKLLTLALQKFETIPQDNTNVKYFTVKKRVVHTIQWMSVYNRGNYASEPEELPPGFCSNPDTNEKVLELPDSPIRDAWFYLAQIEYKFGHGTTALDHVLQITDRDAVPVLGFFLSILEVQYDFKNKTFNKLPEHIHQLVNARASIQRYNQSEKGIENQGVNSMPIPNPPDFTSVENITNVLVASILVQLSAGVDTHKILTLWREDSSESSIKENMTTAFNLIESMLFGDQNNALRVMKAQDAKSEECLAAALKIIHSTETSSENLFHAHALIAPYLVSSLIWLDSFETGLAELLSVQWLEKIKFRATLKTPMITVPRIEQVCNSNETGKKKIGQILLAAHQAVSIRVAPEILQQFRNWAESESEQKQEPITGKNRIAQRLIEAMEKPPHLTDEDVEALNQSIKEGKIPIKFDSPFEPDERENNE